nr:MAG TPA: hypothetical protein [Caudoviricetes sp.]
MFPYCFFLVYNLLIMVNVIPSVIPAVIPGTN